MIRWLWDLVQEWRRRMSGEPKCWKGDTEGLYMVATRTAKSSSGPMQYGRIVMLNEKPGMQVGPEEFLGSVGRFMPDTKWEPCDPPQEVLDLVAQAPPTKQARHD